MNGQQLDIFYNTTHLGAEEAIKRARANGDQSRKILHFFESNPAGFFTPFEVQEGANMLRTPITSIRRALHDLTQAGYLVKTDVLKDGEYGTPNHTWKLAK